MPISLVTAPTAREAPSDTISSNTTTSTIDTTSATGSHTPQKRQKLSEVLPPLVFGTATLNWQFNVDPYALHPNSLVSNALASGVRAFDTSPYYGPAEEILGAALHSSEVTSHPSLTSLRREDYYILTKAGRIAGDEFDYSPSWIRHSIKRSLRRLKTRYLDVVYLHDVEFVSPGEVLSAIRTLREIRDTTGTIHHVGICGYPVQVLTSLAEMILHETGEPLDIVQSYANFTIQNQRLRTEGLHRFIEAGVDVVANASPLGMGLLRGQGPPIGAMGNWHPAPNDLRAACLKAATYVQEDHNEKLETVAVRFAMENWLTIGSPVGSKGPLPSEVLSLTTTNKNNNNIATTIKDDTSATRPKLGVNVMGISKLNELNDTMAVYNSIISGITHPSTSTSAFRETQPSQHRKLEIQHLSNTIRNDIFGSLAEYAWSSPDPGFVNQRKAFGVSIAEKEEFEKVFGVVGDDDVEGDRDNDNDIDETTLADAVRHLNGLERSVTGASASVGAAGEKNGEVDIEIEETGREMKPPR